LELKKLIIAIDGSAASGKSTTARQVAQALGYLHIDTGAMYRAVTLKVLRKGVAPDDQQHIEPLLRSTTIRTQYIGDTSAVFLDNEDVTKEIRTPAVTNAVSAVSSLLPVRELMVREQREMGRNGRVVLEGRDIGTVVFPSADLKIFMIADACERASRRQKEFAAQGVSVDEEALVAEIIERDRKDSTRIHSPLRQAQDAVVLDTTTLTIKEQVDFIVAKALERMK
jgi:cytidylate kinase